MQLEKFEAKYNSNADNVNKVMIHNECRRSYRIEYVDKYIDGFAIDPTKARKIKLYENNENLY